MPMPGQLSNHGTSDKFPSFEDLPGATVDPLIYEISLLHACNRLCSRITPKLALGAQDRIQMMAPNPEVPQGYAARRSDVLAMLQNGVGALYHPGRNPAASLTARELNTMGPGHNVRYDGGTRNPATPFSFNDELNGRVDCNSHQASRSAFQNPMSSGAKSDRSLSVASQQEPIKHPSGRNSTDSVADRSKKQKGIPFCMIHSCQSLSEPCKRKLKLCSEHKKAAQVQLYKDGPFQRYCRYCHVLHDLDAFPKEDVRTICVMRNELRLKRSRERRKEIRHILTAEDARRSNNTALEDAANH